MPPDLDNLRHALGLCSADQLPVQPLQAIEGITPWLTPRHVHEFATDANPAERDWLAPLTLLAAFAIDLAKQGPIVWIGRRCWPTFQTLVAAPAKPLSELKQHLFLDPLSDAERLWALLETARCPAVRVVVADGGGLNATAGRRLQLAAETGNAVMLLARPPSELGQGSWAATRWRVRPMVSLGNEARWNVALVRAVGAGQGQDASRQWICSWTYEVFRGTGALGLSAVVGRGTGATAATEPARNPHQQTA